MNTATNEDLEIVAALLRYESNKTLERIRPNDHPAIKESLVTASVHMDDIAERIENSATRQHEADEMSAGLFVALIAVAERYVESIGGGAASLDSMLIAIRENLR